MRLLLDTHVLIWALDDSPRLGPAGRKLLRDPEHQCWVSAASVWEIAIKAGLGKLKLDRPLKEIESAIREAGLEPLDITPRHAAAVADLEITHADPFDRLLLAQCEVETLRLLSADRALASYPGVLALS